MAVHIVGHRGGCYNGSYWKAKGEGLATNSTKLRRDCRTHAGSPRPKLDPRGLYSLEVGVASCYPFAQMRI